MAYPRFGFVVAAMLALSLPMEARAQETASQVWGGLFLTARQPGRPERGWSIWHDQQWRRSASNTVTVTRPGIGYRVDPNWSGWLGYGHIGTWMDDDQSNVHEHRVWQQALGTSRLGPLSMQIRPRLEQRMMAGHDVAHRVRLLGRLNVDLWGPIVLATTNEIFVAMGDTSWGAPGGFDQNRLTLGLGYVAGPMRVELAYLHIIRRMSTEVLEHQRNAALWVMWAY